MAKKVNLDISENLDITCRRGDTFSLTLTLKDSSGTAIQLSTLNYSFTMDVKSSSSKRVNGVKQRETVASSVNSPSVSDLKTLSAAQKTQLTNGFEFTDISDNGTVKLTATADTMKQFPVGVFTYDIQQEVGGVISTILRGSFTVKEDISG
jgi:hypothetical protein